MINVEQNICIEIIIIVNDQSFCYFNLSIFKENVLNPMGVGLYQAK